jgi:hypothetical protein
MKNTQRIKILELLLAGIQLLFILVCVCVLKKAPNVVARCCTLYSGFFFPTQNTKKILFFIYTHTKVKKALSARASRKHAQESSR